jgi:hypothetical protein
LPSRLRGLFLVTGAEWEPVIATIRIYVTVQRVISYAQRVKQDIESVMYSRGIYRLATDVQSRLLRYTMLWRRRILRRRFHADSHSIIAHPTGRDRRVGRFVVRIEKLVVGVACVAVPGTV